MNEAIAQAKQVLRDWRNAPSRDIAGLHAAEDQLLEACGGDYPLWFRHWLEVMGPAPKKTTQEKSDGRS